MNSFTGKPALTTERTLTNDDFWLDLNMGEFLSGYRIPAEYADNTNVQGLRMAMINVNGQLSFVKTAILAQGYANLTAYTATHSELIDAEPLLALQYKHAVFCHAKAFLLQQFNSMNRKANAEEQAKESPDVALFWLNQSQKAVHFFSERFAPDEHVTANYGVRVSVI